MSTENPSRSRASAPPKGHSAAARNSAGANGVVENLRMTRVMIVHLHRCPMSGPKGFDRRRARKFRSGGGGLESDLVQYAQAVGRSFGPAPTLGHLGGAKK